MPPAAEDVRRGLRVAQEVEQALDRGGPVVALESSVVAHGLPQPHNLTAARRMVAVGRATGAIPAMTALVAGEARVGLSDQDVQALADRDDVAKVSVHNLAAHQAAGHWGGTTVAGTMVLAAAAGIRVLATGGIGGVHRGREWDVSADLPMLARTSMIVVASGAKSLLDLPRTWEWLETHGVVVLGYGTDELPAFYSRSSGLRLALSVETPGEVVETYLRQRELRLPAAVLVAVPVPEPEAVPEVEVEEALSGALASAEMSGVEGAAVTPYLLTKVAEATAGRALRANLALLENNARVGAEVAVELARRAASR